jgi:hypothetical protein
MYDKGAEHWRQQYRRAMRTLRHIPSGTLDAELTLEERRAWRQHDEAIAHMTRERLSNALGRRSA